MEEKPEDNDTKEEVPSVDDALLPKPSFSRPFVTRGPAVAKTGSSDAYMSWMQKMREGFP